MSALDSMRWIDMPFIKTTPERNCKKIPMQNGRLLDTRHLFLKANY